MCGVSGSSSLASAACLMGVTMFQKKKKKGKKLTACSPGEVWVSAAQQQLMPLRAWLLQPAPRVAAILDS